MTSQTEKQTITINILLDISKSKNNQTMRFGQVIEYSVRNISFQKSCRKWKRETNSDLFLFFKKLYIKQRKWSAS